LPLADPVLHIYDMMIRNKDNRTERRTERIREVAAKRRRDLTLILANIHDPHNVSAILRSCDAFGVFGVHLYYTHESFPALGKKSSASAKKWVETWRERDAEKLMSGLASRGFKILSTGFDENARPLQEVDFTRPTAVVLGNEHRGVDPELADRVDGGVYIPMQGMVQSFNVSVAAAIILYEAWRQRWAAGMIDESGFAPEELESLVEEWCRR
jgi:tRNA (guanosine-2'-O-)-methyltransferase